MKCIASESYCETAQFFAETKEYMWFSSYLGCSERNVLLSEWHEYVIRVLALDRSIIRQDHTSYGSSAEIIRISTDGIWIMNLWQLFMIYT